jgi:hypothetical protein
VGKRGLRSSFGIPGTGLSFSGSRSGGAFGILIGFTIMAFMWAVMLVVKLVIAAIPLLWRLVIGMFKITFQVSSWAISAVRRLVAPQKQMVKAPAQPTTTKQAKPKKISKVKE